MMGWYTRLQADRNLAVVDVLRYCLGRPIPMEQPYVHCFFLSPVENALGGFCYAGNLDVIERVAFADLKYFRSRHQRAVMGWLVSNSDGNVRLTVFDGFRVGVLASSFLELAAISPASLRDQLKWQRCRDFSSGLTDRPLDEDYVQVECRRPLEIPVHIITDRFMHCVSRGLVLCCGTSTKLARFCFQEFCPDSNVKKMMPWFRNVFEFLFLETQRDRESLQLLATVYPFTEKKVQGPRFDARLDGWLFGEECSYQTHIIHESGKILWTGWKHPDADQSDYVEYDWNASMMSGNWIEW